MAKKRAVRTVKDKAAKEIQRLWGNLPVVDAKHDLRIFINPCDVKLAKRKEPDSCVFAQACKRVFGSKRVMFLRSVAYVELADEQGNRRAERFLLGEGMRDLIEAFDKGKGVIPEAGFLLRAPSASHTLEYNRRRNIRWNKDRAAKRRKQQRKEGTYQRRGNQGVGAHKSQPVVSDVRNGKGTVHFTTIH